jgi:hypothetical protein
MKNETAKSKAARAPSSPASTTAMESSLAAPDFGEVITVAASASTVTLRDANPSRKGMVIHNDSSALMKVALAPVLDASTAFTVKIPPGGNYELPVVQGGVYAGEIVGVWDTATGNALLTEFELS